MEQVIYNLNTKGFDALRKNKFIKAQDYFNMAIVTIIETKQNLNELNNIRYNLGIAYLKDNVYSYGFNNYRSVLDCSYIGQRDFYDIKKHLTKASQIKDQCVLIYNLISIDYFILFCRYIPQFIELYSPQKVIIEVHEYILPFLSKIPLLKDCSFVSHASIESFDCHMEISTLPYFIDINSSYETFDHLIPYVFPNNEITEKQTKMLKPLIKNSKKTILLNWTINPNFERSNINEMDINYIKEFTEKFPTVKFICAQDPIQDSTINNILINKNIQNYEQTSSMISLVDFVITTCSFLAHVAAAMGKKVLLLLDTNHEWLWYNTNWYPTVKIFKQRHCGDWFHVFEDLTLYLKSQIC